MSGSRIRPAALHATRDRSRRPSGANHAGTVLLNIGGLFCNTHYLQRRDVRAGHRDVLLRAVGGAERTLRATVRLRFLLRHASPLTTANTSGYHAVTVPAEGERIQSINPRADGAAYHNGQTSATSRFTTRSAEARRSHHSQSGRARPTPARQTPKPARGRPGSETIRWPQLPRA